jgi:Uma2 family endonuclease
MATAFARDVGWYDGQYHGVRMTADEFFDLPDDGYRYELVQGVVVMSPSPKPRHQAVAMEITAQLNVYLRKNPVGQLLAHPDVHLGRDAAGKDFVYRPDILFIPAARWNIASNRLVGPPELAVEVVSRGSRRYDSETKKEDYERFGVREYWLVDPERNAMSFYRRNDEGRFVEASIDGDLFRSEAVPGFALDLRLVRATFESDPRP